MSHRCRICGNVAGNEAFVVREMMLGLRDEFEYFMCSACGCLQIAEVPEDLAPYYPPDYYSYSAIEWPDPRSLGVRARRSRTRHHLGSATVIGAALARVFGEADLPRWVRGGHIHVHSRILDVGCGSGQLLASLMKQGFTELTGLDPYAPVGGPTEAPIRILRQELDELDEEFDLVMFHHSFEHLPDPLRALSTVEARLRPGGAVVIRVPVVPSVAWETYGTDWVQLDAPRHLYLHSEESLGLSASQSGFEIESVFFDSTAFQFLGSEQYRLGIPLQDPRSFTHGLDGSVFSEEKVERFTVMARDVNEAGRGDQACFILRRGADTVD